MSEMQQTLITRDGTEYHLYQRGPHRWVWRDIDYNDTQVSGQDPHTAIMCGLHAWPGAAVISHLAIAPEIGPEAADYVASLTDPQYSGKRQFA